MRIKYRGALALGALVALTCCSVPDQRAFEEAMQLERTLKDDTIPLEQRVEILQAEIDKEP